MLYLFGKIFRFFLVLYVGVFCFLLVRPFPRELAYTPVPVSVAPTSVTFLADVTYAASSSAPRIEESIFPAMLDAVKHSDLFVYADMFLFNEFQGKEPQTYRYQTTELADALIAKKSTRASSTVVFMTDPINRGYGGVVNPELDRMEKSGVLVYETPLEKLRDSNLLWSTVYHMIFQWIPNSTERGWLPNPLDASGEKVTLRTYARLLNFKANHRKVLVTDEIVKGERELAVIVGSLNPHTASSANGNTALFVHSTPLGRQVLLSESALVDLGKYPPVLQPPFASSTILSGGVTATYLTETHIEKSLAGVIDGLSGGEDKLDIAVFYLSDSHVIKAIERAGERGVKVRILLDPNDAAFGRHKGGIPNRQTVLRFIENKDEDISIKWCNTHGEQCHAKMLLATGGGKSTLLVGSSNYTRRNLDKFNLESAILVESTVPMKAMVDAHQYFDRVWNNTKGETSVPLETYTDTAEWKAILAWIMENTGLSTF